MDSAQQDVRDARAVEDRRGEDLANTRINLVNGTANGTAIDMNLTNNGSVIIHVNSLEVLVNGTLYSASVTLKAVNGATGTNLWAPSQTLRLVVAAPVAGPAGVRLITDTGYAFQGTVS